MKKKHTPSPVLITPIEKLTSWIGSYTSLMIHTLVFVLSFMSVLLGFAALDIMLLILTTAVSLEAIYLAIFIQMSVNNQSSILHEVEQDIDEISEDVEEIQEDIDEIQEDVDEIQEDIDEIQEDVDEITTEETIDRKIDEQQSITLEKITSDIERLLKDIETLKQTK